LLPKTASAKSAQIRLCELAASVAKEEGRKKKNEGGYQT
jgi:hypothetical protein